MFVTICVVVLIIFLLVSGYPLFVPLVAGTLALIFFNAPNLDLIMVIQQYITGVSAFVLLSIPMFIFAADIMSFGNTSTRLVDLVKAFCGHIYGGLAVTVAGACTIFGAISGSANATVVAIGKPMRSKMLENGYDVYNTDALIVSAATIAALIPPSINMIMYCVMTGTSVGELFIAGVFPGVLVFLVFAAYNYFHAKKHNVPRTERISWRSRLQVTKKSLLALGFPVLIIGGIYSGIFSPTEAAAMSVFYAVACEMLVYKTVKVKDLAQIALSTGVMTSTIFILIAVGQGFSWIVAYLQLPQKVTAVLLGTDPSALKVSLVVTVAFLVACMFVDQVVAMLILLPIFFPVAMSAGLDPIYLGVVVSLQAAIGSVTPPFGPNIFVACAAFEQPYMKIVKGLPPYLFLFFMITVLIIAVPEISLAYRLFF